MSIVLKPEDVAQLVFFIRGEKIMLDVDLAKLYGVATKALNQAVGRNRSRFPEDFAFRLSRKEFDSMRSQIVTTSKSRPTIWSQIVTTSQKYRRADSLPYAVTEQGVAMLSSVLRSARAVEVNIAIMRTFVQLRRLMDSNADLARKIEGLERKYDEKFAVVFAAIKQLMAPPKKPRREIGFHVREGPARGYRVRRRN
jgi:ORF6N domain